MSWLRLVGSALLGALYYRGVIAFSNVARIPRFVPQWDESDSNLRGAVLVLIGFPWFLVLGALLGRSADLRAFGVRWAGLVAGTAVSLSVAALLSPVLARISTRFAANAASVILILLIPLASTLGAWLAGRRATVNRDVADA